jgi:hypothetical protein
LGGNYNDDNAEIDDDIKEDNIGNDDDADVIDIDDADDGSQAKKIFV